MIYQKQEQGGKRSSTINHKPEIDDHDGKDSICGGKWVQGGGGVKKSFKYEI